MIVLQEKTSTQLHLQAVRGPELELGLASEPMQVSWALQIFRSGSHAALCSYSPCAAPCSCSGV